jgi:hypothetical protein
LVSGAAPSECQQQSRGDNAQVHLNVPSKKIDRLNSYM